MSFVKSLLRTVLSVDANAGKGTLLRTGAGNAKHPRTKELSAQGGIKSYGAKAQKVPRAENAVESLTHPLGS